MKLLEFLRMVRVEATHIRDNATKEEKSRLDFDELKPKTISNCIYGQMTGFCESKRAIELYPKSLYWIREFDYSNSDYNLHEALYRIEKTLLRGFNLDTSYTPLEMYAITKGANNEGLIKYIKGINKTLKL
jgi:hypothetical protein